MQIQTWRLSKIIKILVNRLLNINWIKHKNNSFGVGLENRKYSKNMKIAKNKHLLSSAFHNGFHVFYWVFV